MSKSRRKKKKQVQKQAQAAVSPPPPAPQLDITLVTRPPQRPETPVSGTLVVQRSAKSAAAKPRIRDKWARLACFYLFIAYLEVAFNLLVVDAPGGWGLLYGLLFALPTALLLFALCSLFSPRVNRRLAVMLGAVITVAYCAQLVYHQVFGTYFILFSVLNGGQVLEFFSFIALTVVQNLNGLAFLLLPFLVLVCYGRQRLTFPQVRLRRAVRPLLLSALCYGLCLVSLLMGGTDALSPFGLYFNTSDVIFSVERLGLSATLQVDVARTLTGFRPADPGPVLGPPPTVAYVSEDEPAVAAVATQPRPTQAPTEAATTLPPFVPQPQVMDIDFDALIEAETNPTLLEMHQYFADQAPTYTNEKTGLFAGSNVVFIVAEGFSHYAIDPERTPTLYKMATEGFEFTSFYNPVWSVSTSDGEYVASQGLIPKSGVWSFKASSDNWLPFQLGRALPALGYSAHGYHNHSHTYYGRNLSHPNLGYDFKAVGAGLDMEPTWPESDLEMIDETTADYMGSTPFLAYYMTVSGHLKYNFNGNSMAWKHYDLTKDMEASEAVRAYISCNYELELAMTLLLERLEAAGQLENTLIVISADHYPYGLEPQEINEIAGHEVDPDFELYKSALILYRAGTPHEVIDRPCSSLDILPTVLNLLGVEFDSRLLMGRDIFSDTEPLIIFSNRSFITRDARYNTRTKELLPNEGVQLPDDYRKYWSTVINQKFTYSARILDEDYYRVLWPQAAAAAEAGDAWRE